MNLNLLVLRCVELEGCRRFYETLGFEFIKEQHGKGPEHFACENDGRVFELYPAAAGKADQTGLGFASPDLAESHRRFLAAGFVPGEMMESTRSFVIRDPDGRRVEVRATNETGVASA